MRIVEARVERRLLRYHSPITTAHGTIADRWMVLLTLVDEDGNIGLGEAAPLAGFTPDTVEIAESALRRWAADQAGGGDPPASVTARAAVDSALLDLAARIAATSVHWLLAPGSPDLLAVSALATGASVEAIAASAAAAVASGHGTVKIKVGTHGMNGPRPGVGGAIPYRPGRAAEAGRQRRMGSPRGPPASGPAGRVRHRVPGGAGGGHRESGFGAYLFTGAHRRGRVSPNGRRHQPCRRDGRRRPGRPEAFGDRRAVRGRQGCCHSPRRRNERRGDVAAGELCRHPCRRPPGIRHRRRGPRPRAGHGFPAGRRRRHTVPAGQRRTTAGLCPIPATR